MRKGGMGYEFDAQGEQRLDGYISRFGEVLGHKKKREAFALYVTGLLSNLERKSVEPIAALASPAGQASIAEYKIGGEQLFFPNAGSK